MALEPLWRKRKLVRRVHGRSLKAEQTGDQGASRGILDLALQEAVMDLALLIVLDYVAEHIGEGALVRLPRLPDLILCLALLLGVGDDQGSDLILASYVEQVILVLLVEPLKV